MWGKKNGTIKEEVCRSAGEELIAELQVLLSGDLSDDFDFEAFESTIRKKLMQIAARLIERYLNADQSDCLASSHACSCGGDAKYKGRRKKEFSSMVGIIVLERAYYHCCMCGSGFSPRDRVLKLEGRSMTGGLMRLIASVSAMVSFQESSDLLKELAVVEVEAKQVERIAEAIGQEVAEYERSESQSIGNSPPAPTMYLGLDGTGIPMRSCELQGRTGKQPDGSAKTREVKLVTIWSAESKDEEGLPVRDAGSVSYSAAIESARMLDTKEPLSPFANRVSREAKRRDFQKAKRQVALGDGAAWIWNIVGELFPKAIQVVDRFHVKENLAKVSKIIWGPESQIGKEWLNQRYQELDQGQIPILIAAFKPHKKYPEVKRFIHYLKQNMHRMRYDEFRQQGICTSSGVLEAGCKVAIGTRLKRAGMHWTLNGSNAIIALRCSKLSGTFEDFWEWRSSKSDAA